LLNAFLIFLFCYNAFLNEQVNEKASENFQKMPKSYKRNFVLWIDSARKEETRRTRVAEALALLEKKEKLGMK